MNRSNIQIAREGKIQAVLLDVDGFLGMGEKQVRVSMDSLTITPEVDTGEVRVHVEATNDALMAQPEHSSRNLF